MVFGWFETRVDPYPEAPPAPPPSRFIAFLWAGTAGMRGWILGMALLTATIGAFEALLFAMLGRVVDWLGHIEPARLWVDQGDKLLWLGGIIVGSGLLVALQTAIKHQTLAGNFPMRLRWTFHRLMLAQSMSFYQDEFAGRVAAKVMQTALAVRDTCLIMTDILVFVVIYFVTIAAVAGSFDVWLLLPFCGWLTLYLVTLRVFVPRLCPAPGDMTHGRCHRVAAGPVRPGLC